MQGDKKKAFLVFVLLAIITITVAAFQGNSQAARTASTEDEATPVQEGVMTKKQKQHSRHFEIEGGKRLSDFTNPDGNVDVGQGIPLRILPKYSSTQEYLKSLGCKANAVIVGVVKGKSSQLTEGKTSIFTDYELKVEDVLKNNVAASTQVNSDLTISRPGGAVRLNGRILRAKDDRFEPLHVGDHYMLFLGWEPASGDYVSISHTGDSSFQIRDGKTMQVSGESLPLGPTVQTNSAGFINDARAALNTACAN
jgi:hypothetical protein